jgi:hypothetical protein
MMLPPFLPGLPGAAELDLTLVFSPLLIGLMAVLGILAFSFVVYAWCSYLINAPLQKAVYPRRFVCPIKPQMVEAQFVAWKGQPWHPLDVERCSGWCLGIEKNCNKECIALFDAPAPCSPSLFL